METIYRIIVGCLLVASVASMALGLCTIRDRAPHCIVGAVVFLAGAAMLVSVGFLVG